VVDFLKVEGQFEVEGLAVGLRTTEQVEVVLVVAPSI
jgi:hypothetical protein